MNPITREQEFMQFQIDRLIKEQEKTNQLLRQLVKLQTPEPAPVKATASRKKPTE